MKPSNQFRAYNAETFLSSIRNDLWITEETCEWCIAHGQERMLDERYREMLDLEDQVREIEALQSTFRSTTGGANDS